MKVFVVTLALAGLASAATLDAQIMGSRPVPSTSGPINVDASWRAVGRDANGNAIYERRTRDVNGNILVHRAVRDRNGKMQIISSSTEVVDNRAGNRGRTDCDYTRSGSTVGDIIFGRSNNQNNVNCDGVGSRIDGGWYQIGPGPRNNSEYVRRIRDSQGNLVIQRARRDRNGNFRIISTRYARDNDKEWKKANKDYDNAVKRAEQDDRSDSGMHKGKR